THCRSALENARSCWAVGSAMFTTVASSTTISWARQTTPRISQRRPDTWSASAGPAGPATPGAAALRSATRETTGRSASWAIGYLLGKDYPSGRRRTRPAPPSACYAPPVSLAPLPAPRSACHAPPVSLAPLPAPRSACHAPPVSLAPRPPSARQWPNSLTAVLILVIVFICIKPVASARRASDLDWRSLTMLSRLSRRGIVLAVVAVTAGVSAAACSSTSAATSSGGQ